MSTTDTGTATITLTGPGPRAYGTHASPHRPPTDPGLPGVGFLPTFAELWGEGPRTMADLAGDLDRLAPAPCEQLFRAQPLPAELFAPSAPSTASALLGREAGERSTAYVPQGGPGLTGRRSDVPSLRTLVRFAAVADELAGLRARFAAHADRSGPEAVARSSRRLLAVFEDGVAADPARCRTMAALVRPLSPPAGLGRGSGLALELRAREFGPGGVERFEEVDFPATLTHEPTRRFLCEVGLPLSKGGFPLRRDTDMPLPTLPEYCADRGPDQLPPAVLPFGADQMIRLGGLPGRHSLVVDGTTGAVLTWNEPEGTLHPLTTDVSTLAVTLWLTHRENPAAVYQADGNPAAGHASHEPTTAPYDRLAAAMTEALSAIDPPAMTSGTDWHSWTRLLQAEASGLLS